MWKYYNPTFEFRSEMPLNLAYAPWGGHSYFAYDLDNWSPKVKSNGIVMFHDIAETGRDFGVYRLWEELEGVNTLAFPFYHGLGVVFLGNKLGDKPVDNACIDHYKQLADKLG